MVWIILGIPQIPKVHTIHCMWTTDCFSKFSNLNYGVISQHAGFPVSQQYFITNKICIDALCIVFHHFLNSTVMFCNKSISLLCNEFVLSVVCDALNLWLRAKTTMTNTQTDRRDSERLIWRSACQHVDIRHKQDQTGKKRQQKPWL